MAKAAWRVPGSKAIYLTLMGRLHPDVVEVDGHTMRLDVTDSLLLSVNGTYEPVEMAMFSHCIRNGDTVVDIGAHIGLYTLQAARAVGPSGRVLAFEPMTSNYALLTENVSRNGYGYVETMQVALADAEGEARLGKSDLNTGDNSITSPGDRSEMVRTLTLDQVMGDRTRIDVVKMDIQGAEPLALAGAKNVFAANENLILFTELSPDHLPGGAASYLGSLTDLGFNLFEINEVDRSLRPTDAEELTRLSLAESATFTNLICAKGTAANESLKSLAASAGSL